MNILEYIGFSDVVRYTAYPIATAFLLNGLGLLVPELTGIQMKLPPGGGRETQIGRVLNLDFAPVIFKRIIKVLLIVLCILVALETFTADRSDKWFLLPLWAGFLLAKVAGDHGFLASRVADGHRRYIFTVILIALPLWLYGNGRRHAHHIMDNSEYDYLASSVDGLIDVHDSRDPNQQTKYLGHAGDYLFFLQARDVLVVMRLDQVKLLKLKHIKKS